MTSQGAVHRRLGLTSTRPDKTKVHLKRRRGRSLSLRVMPDGSLKVNAPLSVSHRQIEDFIATRKRWIDRRREEYERLYDFRARPRLADGLLITIVAGPSLTAKEGPPGEIIVACPPSTSNLQVYSQVRSLIKHRLTELGKAVLPRELAAFASQKQLNYKSTTIKYMRSRWGSCTSEGKICLNSQLMRLPIDLRQYVIAHELAHVQVPDHSARFHALLGEILPDAARLRRNLRRYGLFY